MKNEGTPQGRASFVAAMAGPRGITTDFSSSGQNLWLAELLRQLINIVCHMDLRNPRRDHRPSRTLPCR